MFRAFPDLPSRAPDVLVVGSGPAGLALAVALSERGATVTMLESGGTDAVDDALNDVDATGLAFPGARDGRARGFGGTGEKWAGQCRPLDPLDLEARPWVPGSGWPLTPQELEPWIARASSFFRLDGATYTPQDVAPVLALPEVDPTLLQWRVLRYSPAHRAGSRLRARITTDPLLTVVTGATVVGLLRQGDRVTGVRVAGRGGQARDVAAPETVLAAGALENARLLLLAGEDGGPVPGGTGGWVGRGLQDHPHWLVGEVMEPHPALGVAFQSTSPPGGRARAKLALPPEQQRAQQTLNAVLDVELEHGPRSAAGAAKRLWDARQQRVRPQSPWRDVARLLADPKATAGELRARQRGTGAPADRHTRLLVRVQTEQPPAGPSRVLLSDRRDALGCRRASVHWTVGEDERRTCLVAAELARQALADAGLGRLRVEPWLADLTDFRSRAQDFYHHAGTTRMSYDPADGVVDPQGAVHGTPGLHVTGGSVFPTSGYANPTLTIVALALRLADSLAVPARA